MTQKTFFFFIILITLANAAIFAGSLFYINPETTSLIGYIFFYSSTFLLCFGGIFLINYIMHSKIMQWNLVYKNIQVSTRHGFLFSILVVSCLILQAQRLLSWLNLVVLILLLTFIEFIFITKRSTNNYGRKTQSN